MLLADDLWQAFLQPHFAVGVKVGNFHDSQTASRLKLRTSQAHVIYLRPVRLYFVGIPDTECAHNGGPIQRPFQERNPAALRSPLPQPANSKDGCGGINRKHKKRKTCRAQILVMPARIE